MKCLKTHKKTIVPSRKRSLSMNNRRKSSGGLLEEVGPISRAHPPAFSFVNHSAMTGTPNQVIKSKTRYCESVNMK